MKEETPKIAAKPRPKIGSIHARRLRRQGRLPAVVYGHKESPVPISVDEKEMLIHLRHGTHVLTLQVEGSKPETVLVKELQFGYLGDDVIHVDFARVDLEEQVQVAVQLRFAGQPRAAQQAGAILSHDLTVLEVICRVNEIPEEIRVDLTTMGDNGVLTVGELKLPPNVRAAVDADSPVSHIAFVRQEEAVTVGEEAEVAAAPAEPEVITAAKATEEPAEGAERPR